MRVIPVLVLYGAVFGTGAMVKALGQIPAAPAPAAGQPVGAGSSGGLRTRDPASLPGVAVGPKPVIINGRPYQRPTQHQFFVDYLRDSYGLPALARSTVRALYSQGRGTPAEWSTDAEGFGQRFGSSLGVTAINGNVRYGMEEIFHEDLRYIPCHGCSAKHKLENALLAEITARHATDGHRFFTLTPTVADFSGPIIAHTLWYPDNGDPALAGVISARTVFATRIGGHLFWEFVLERRHKDPPEAR
jgi:hypothetical protein